MGLLMYFCQKKKKRFRFRETTEQGSRCLLPAKLIRHRSHRSRRRKRLRNRQREMEEEAMEMDAKESQYSSSSFKRFGLKNSIQTNFGQDYVFQIAQKDDSTLMAVSLSSQLVKLYSPTTGQYFGECIGHSGTINHISFSGPYNPHLLHSCSSDSTIRAWDTRTFKQVSEIRAEESPEIFSFAFGGAGENLLAAGCDSKVRVWDWRNMEHIACLEESHVDDITQVHFAPNHRNKLLSASADGLICIFQTDGDINDDEHLESVINVGTSVGKVGFFGDNYEKIWCLTQIETLSVWDLKDARVEFNFQDARSLASDSWSLGHVDYFIDCCSGDDERLWVIGGTNAGTLGFFPVNYTAKGGIGSPEAVLEGGHTGIVRSVLPLSAVRSGSALSRGVFGWTGSEDGRLCCWFSDEASEMNNSWISSALVMKTDKSHRKARHRPY